MKLSLYFAIIIIAFKSAAGLAQRADFFVYKPFVKFEKIKEGQTITHYFKFKNKGKIPLIIEDYGVSCHCTKIDFPKYPIAPGAIDSLKLSFDSKGKTGKQSREVVIFSNAKQKESFLNFKVFVD